MARKVRTAMYYIIANSSGDSPKVDATTSDKYASASVKSVDKKVRSGFRRPKAPGMRNTGRRSGRFGQVLARMTVEAS